MEATYDPDADAAYVRVRQKGGPCRTEVADDGSVLDLDEESDDVVGYELLSVRSRGLEAFKTVPDAGRQLVFRAMEAARVDGHFIRITDVG
jgi:uncharacterized protein YuzE